MAKRRSRSEAHGTSTVSTPGAPGTPAQPAKGRRAQSTGAATSRGTETGEAPAGIQTQDTFAARAGAHDRSPKDASSSDTRSDSMASEPSEEAIRLRAYQRYLERGAGDGRHCEDWLEAERELKTKG